LLSAETDIKVTTTEAAGGGAGVGVVTGGAGGGTFTTGGTGGGTFTTGGGTLTIGGCPTGATGTTGAMGAFDAAAAGAAVDTSGLNGLRPVVPSNAAGSGTGTGFTDGDGSAPFRTFLVTTGAPVSSSPAGEEQQPCRDAEHDGSHGPADDEQRRAP
jgi:hypothetical protein